MIINGDSGLVFPNSSTLDKAPYGKQTIWIPAAAMYPTYTAGAVHATQETATNKLTYKTLFFDSATKESAEFAVLMPKGWDEGAISYKVIWSHATTATNFGVAFSVAGVSFSDGESRDAAYGTAQKVYDVGGTAASLYTTPESSGITIANTPAEGDFIILRLSREVADVSDTLAVDALVYGVHLYYTTNVVNDA